MAEGWRKLWGISSKRSEHSFALRLFSFVLLVFCVSSLFFLRIHSMGNDLPATSGGVIGSTLGTLALKGFGFEGATVLLIALCALFSSLFFGFSWGCWAEKVGRALVGLISRVKDKSQERKDEEISRMVKADRERAKSGTRGLKNFFKKIPFEEKSVPVQETFLEKKELPFSNPAHDMSSSQTPKWQTRGFQSVDKASGSAGAEISNPAAIPSKGIPMMAATTVLPPSAVRDLTVHVPAAALPGGALRISEENPAPILRENEEMVSHALHSQETNPIQIPESPVISSSDPSQQSASVFSDGQRKRPVLRPVPEVSIPTSTPGLEDSSEERIAPASSFFPSNLSPAIPPAPVWRAVPDASSEIPQVASAFRGAERGQGQEVLQEKAMQGAVRSSNALEQISSNGVPKTSFREIPPADPAKEDPKEPQSTFVPSACVEEPSFILPSLNLLEETPDDDAIISEAELSLNSRRIKQILSNFKLSARVVGAIPGPVITQFRVRPREGTRGSKFIQISKDLARGLGQPSVRVVENIGEINCLGLEVPNSVSQNISLIEIIDSKVFYESKSKLTLALGKSITGDPMVTDLTKAPHLLVAGSTGSGKSVGINAMILSMLFKCTPEDLRLVLIDPKQVEFAPYEKIPHLLTEVVTDMSKAVHALRWCVKEMERRYSLMKAIGVRNIDSYHEKLNAERMKGSYLLNPNALPPENPETMPHLPYIVIVVDELADLLGNFGKQVLPHIQSLTQKARAAGLHIILATQRPSNDIIPPVIKANCPTRISFRVSNRYDSMTILGGPGAEDLLGRGDMFFVSAGHPWKRIHGPYVTDEEIMRVTDFLKSQGEPEYVDGVTEPAAEPEEPEEDETEEEEGLRKDPLYDKACQIVLRERRIAIGYLQRRLAIGYNRAANIVERMEREGLVSKPTATGKRQVLAPPPDSFS